MTGTARRIVVGGDGVGAGGVGRGRAAMVEVTEAVTAAVRGAAMGRRRAADMARVPPVVMDPPRQEDRGRRSRVGGVPEKENGAESEVGSEVGSGSVIEGVNEAGSEGIVGGIVRNGVESGENVGEAKGLRRAEDGVPARVDVTRVIPVVKEGRVVVERVATNLDRKEEVEVVEGG